MSKSFNNFLILLYRLAIWNDDINIIKVGQTYTIEGVNVKLYNDDLYLSTTQASVITTSDAIEENPDAQPQEKSPKDCCKHNWSKPDKFFSSV